MQRHARTTVAFGLMCLVATLLLTADRVSAQFRFNPVDEPQVTTEEIRQYEEMLSLSEDQKLFAEGLLEAYMADFQSLREEYRRIVDAARDEFRETRDRKVWEDLQEVSGVYEGRRKQLDEQFLNDFKLVLTAEQAAEWGDVERFRRRFYTLGQGGLVSGETVDLTRIVTDLTLTEEQRESVAPILDRYTEALDRVLVERNELYEQGTSDAMRLWQEQRFDEMQRRFEEARDAATRLRDINRQYARQMEASLGQDAGARFEREFLKRSFPDIYTDSAGMRALDMTLLMEDLTEDQAQRVSDLQTQFMRQVEQSNAQLQTLTEQSEENRSVRDMFGMGRNQGSDELRDARRAREQLDRTVMDRLKSVLTPEQYSQLPGQERPDWRRAIEGGEGERTERPRGEPGEGGERPRRGPRDGGDR